MIQRLERVQQILRERKLDALLVFNRASIRYLTGFTGSAGILIVGADGWATLITDGRYTLQVREETKGLKLHYRITRHYAKSTALELKRREVRQVSFERLYCPVAFHDTMWDELKGRKVRLIGVEGIVEELRAIKTPEEVETIRKASRLADAAFEHALNVFRVGMTERELAWEIEAFLRTHGAEALAFPPIVVAGERTALPHGQPTDRPIQKGDLVTFDLGARVDGYCSDLTRTVVVGRPNADQQRLYRAVWEAQRRGIEALGAKGKARRIHHLVRQILKGYGLEKFFTHGTGHGVGLEVHEFPRIGHTSKDVLKTGMVVTVEPGVYVPGVGGVRLEDLVWLIEDGIEVLNTAPNPPKLWRL